MNELIRTISTDGTVVCCALDSTKMVAEAEQIHTTSAVVTAAMGRLLTAASMMGSMLKDRSDSVTLRMAGDGPVGTIIAVGEGTGDARCYAQNPVVEIPLNGLGKLDVSTAVGREGTLTVIKDTGFDEPTVSTSPIVSGEIAEDITYYYAMSEQVPTVCALGVLVNPDLSVKAAGGYLVQLLPGADESVIDQIEANINEMPPVSSLFSQGLTPLEVAKKALKGFEIDILDERSVAYRCTCSRERVERALISLGAKELMEMAEDQEVTEVSCQFCNKKQIFTRDDLIKLASNSRR